jgi:hypothetical protein
MTAASGGLAMTARSMGPEQPSRLRALARSASAFQVVFALYTTTACFLLLLGLASSVASISVDALDAFQDGAQSGSSFGPLWTLIVQSAPLAEAPGQVLLDYVLSGINLGLGVFLVWRRPRDGVARLLGLAMVGTAAAFNFQAHAAFATVDRFAPELHAIVPIHWVLHAVSGAAYLHALLVFPNGKTVPARLVWLARLAYLFMFEEILLTFVTGSVGLLAVPFQLFFGFRGFTPDVLSKLVDSDAAFVVIFFGILLPIAGATSQVYRYVAISDAGEQARTRLVVLALTLAFGAGTSFLVVATGLTLARGAGVTEHLLGEADFAAFRVLPLLFGVIPAALFLAIVRDRLFDVDLVIGQTLVYGCLTAVLAVIFFGSAYIIQQILGQVIGGPSEFAVASAALINGLLFQPLRRRIQQLLARRIRSQSPGATRALADFRATLRTQELDLGDLRQRVLTAAREVLRPRRLGLWLRDGDGDQVA